MTREASSTDAHEPSPGSPSAPPIEGTDPAGFVARARDALRAAAADQDDLRLAATFRALATPPRRPRMPLVWAALAGALVAAAITWLLVRDTAPTEVAAFDGGAASEVGDEVIVRRDKHGRLAEIARPLDPSGAHHDGERLLFRAGRLIRSEHWRSGVLDGVAVDFDGTGRVVRMQRFVGGVAQPAMTLDVNGHPEDTPP